MGSFFNRRSKPGNVRGDAAVGAFRAPHTPRCSSVHIVLWSETKRRERVPADSHGGRSKASR